MERGKLELACQAGELPQRLGLRTTVKLRLPDGSLDAALGVLQAGGFTAQRNGTGVLVDVPAGEKAKPIHLLSEADMR